MPRGVLNNPDVKPLVHSSTRFEDVKGVDEAKVVILTLCAKHLTLLFDQAELEEIVHYLRDPDKFTALGGKLPKVRTRGKRDGDGESGSVGGVVGGSSRDG